MDIWTPIIQKLIEEFSFMSRMDPPIQKVFENRCPVCPGSPRTSNMKKERTNYG